MTDPRMVHIIRKVQDAMQSELFGEPETGEQPLTNWDGCHCTRSPIPTGYPDVVNVQVAIRYDCPYHSDRIPIHVRITGPKPKQEEA